MAKFSGQIGYGVPTQTVPGVWTDVITERGYQGDVLREAKNWQASNQVNDNLTTSNRISIIADSFAYQNLSTMKYVKWAGAYWKISNVEKNHPRLILTLGDVYNGPKA